MKNRSIARRIRQSARNCIMAYKDILIAVSWATLYIGWIVFTMEPILYNDALI